MINFYPEVFQGSLGMLGTPVRSLARDFGVNVRAWIEHREHLYIVAGNAVWRWDGTSAPENISAVATSTVLMNSTGFCRMASNGFDILLTDDRILYAVTFENNVEIVKRVTDGDRPQMAGDVTFADGFFHVLETAEDSWYISENSYDAENWNALDFVKSEFQPDKVRRLFRDRGMIWALNERSIEPYVNTGNTDFPWEPVRDGVSHFGIEGDNTICRVGGVVIFLGRNEQGGRQVYMLGASADPVRISTNHIANYLAGETLGTPYAWSINWKGHDWYVLTLPGVDGNQGITLVYDLTMNIWFEWSTDTGADDDTYTRGRFKAKDHVYFDSKHLVYEDSKVYQLVEGGTHDAVSLRTSRFGKEDQWSAWQSREIGTDGPFTKRLIWRGLGRGRRWTFHLRSTKTGQDDGAKVVRERILDPMQMDDRTITIRKAWIDVEPGQDLNLIVRRGAIE